MPFDYRVPMSPALEAFGVSITVHRVAVDDEPIATTGAWVTSLTQDVPFGGELRRRDRRRVMAVAFTAALTGVPTGTVIYAPEIAGGLVRRWKVDGFEVVESDHVRAVLVPDFELEP